MSVKPLYGKILTTRAFSTQEEARSFAKDYKQQYGEADMSIKYDIVRTASSEWTATLYVKL